MLASTATLSKALLYIYTNLIKFRSGVILDYYRTRSVFCGEKWVLETFDEPGGGGNHQKRGFGKYWVIDEGLGAGIVQERKNLIA
jgi:hypothetical protein